MNRKAHRRAAKSMRTTTGSNLPPLHETLGDAEDLALRLDQDWFRSHPGRSYRIRRTISGEAPRPPQGEAYTVVRQIIPGLRQRLHFSAPVASPEGDAPETVAHAIFDRIEAATGRPGFAEELSRRIRAHAMGSDSKSRPDGADDTIH
jgi:hypothetical protein